MINHATLPCEILIRDIDKLSYHEWLDIRRQGLGGSDVAAALGLSPWKSPLELCLEKIGEAPKTATEPNESMLWGKKMEIPIRDEFARRTGFPVKPLRSMLRHPCFPFMLANLDGLVDVPDKGLGILEIKTASAFKASEWEDGRCPDHYMLQLQHYLSVTGLDYAIICVLIGGNQLKWTTVAADPELIENLITLESDFWRHVTNKVPPPVDGSSACAEMLTRLYPASNKATPLILPQEADNWIQEYLQAKNDADAAEERKRLAENRLKEVMGEHEKALSLGGSQVSWKNFQTNRIDSARLKAEEPVLYEKLCQVSTSRRLSVSVIK
jgi:putative phage-type endonuclease